MRDFIGGTFRGITRSDSQKKVLDAVGASRMPLATLFKTGKQRNLLRALQEAARPIKPVELGVIGSAHLEHACPEAGADLESFKHQKASGVTDGVPWVVEAAFAYRPGAETYRLIYGCNWSPCIGDLFDLDGLLADHWVYDEAPVIVIVHLACPVLAFTDWGKSTLALPYQIEEAVEAVVIKVVAAWTKQCRAEETR